MHVNTVDQLLRRAAERSPDRSAVRSNLLALTYGQLDQGASSFAAALAGAGVRRGDRVALYLPKGIDVVTAIYGSMRAGAAYVPIDPKSPVTRAATIARDCTAGAIVTTPDRAAALLRELDPHRPRIVFLVGSGEAHLDVATERFSAAISSDSTGPAINVADTDLAYILYTSGSTGVPKGVMLTHRNALSFVDWCAGTIGSQPDDRFSSHAPFHFDLSVFDLYVAAHGGATVSLVPDEWTYFGLDLARFIRDEAITVWYSVPSALVLLTDALGAEASLAGLRSVVFAGEVYPTKHLRRLQGLVPQASLWNLYGPTETNVCTYYRVTDLPDDDRPIPIGRACDNSEVFAMRDDGDLADVGEEGELYVRGPSVMEGYWDQPDRTVEVLVPDPRDPVSTERVYRTGDLVRLGPDGNYDFLGRRDHQIKSRGYRIELGEVEAALASHPGLDSVAVVAVPHEQWGTAMVAVVVASAQEDPIAELDVKRWVADRLPRHMVPVRVEIRESLPRTSTGKVDRRSLTDEVVAMAASWA